MSNKPMIVAVAGVGALLLTRTGRARLRAVAPAAQRAVRGRRTSLPKGVEQYPPTLVDRRHRTEQSPDAPPAHATTGAEITAEFYEERPPA